ncbi:hypothetical protein PHSY_000074 [Pseudozyma hubeiensis SY62]|uniref:Uncharacterized protein n=1 Tax=Pseudozyma hubeiensis (strain SY62) TaxID=1305764 RepID=R9P338_PSEHS|nr:hypothetical protein PHSY_000074 [Pseudozyma hubeiensis SY62]GAC92520.1 hypothetical protein PHSY_000074 [Pseudozyma hubeiensis SY62]
MDDASWDKEGQRRQLFSGASPRAVDVIRRRRMTSGRCRLRVVTERLLCGRQGDAAKAKEASKPLQGPLTPLLARRSAAKSYKRHSSRPNKEVKFYEI